MCKGLFRGNTMKDKEKRAEKVRRTVRPQYRSPTRGKREGRRNDG